MCSGCDSAYSSVCFVIVLVVVAILVNLLTEKLVWFTTVLVILALTIFIATLC